MAAFLIPNEILSLSAQAARRLLAEGDGDAALLYLALLEGGGSEERARTALGWEFSRLSAAHLRLVRLELATAVSAPCPTAVPLEEPPQYSRSDILAALEQESSFELLCRAVESCLGRPLGEQDHRTLYTLYDFLALPPEVILMLAHWCGAEAERLHGAGRKPRIGDLKREAFRWKRMGLDTVEGAETFLRRQQELAGREEKLLLLLDIRGRPPVGRERDYLAAWVEMGFADDAIRLAYERTVFQKGQMNWAYMNSILKRWHGEGLHTAEAVQAGDTRPAQAPARPSTPGEERRASANRLKGDVAWLEEFLKQQGG